MSIKKTVLVLFFLIAAGVTICRRSIPGLDHCGS